MPPGIFGCFMRFKTNQQSFVLLYCKRFYDISSRDALLNFQAFCRYPAPFRRPRTLLPHFLKGFLDVESVK